ncbi:MAG TPA: lactate dehydrogenase [Nitrosopumilaceae archaeon]|nr:lactate dehydrogenase [Nitrosopumilaceae archaeon]
MISIIGSGRVGSATAFLAASNSLDDVHLINRTKEKAMGQALDISNAIPENSPISVIASDYSGIKNSEVIVISASTGTYTANRVELLSEQSKMIKEIAKQIKHYSPNSIVLIISNPVDVLTYLFLKESGFPRERVMGMASSMDSSRFRYLIARELGTNQSEIKNALVLGEHGDSMVPIFSRVKWKEKPILDILDEEQIHKIKGDLIFYWKILREYKGPSVFGIAKNTFDIIKAIIKNEKISVPVSAFLNGEYEISDVSLGIPTKIDKNGITEIEKIDLNKSELELLHKSADTIKEYLSKC